MEPEGSPAVRIRQATPEDSDRLFEWANDPATRAASLSPDPIPRVHHDAWIARVLNDPRTRVWIGEAEGRLVGTVRVTVDAGGVGEVSIGLAPEARGRRLSRPLLEAGLGAAASELPVATFLARIRPENERSVRLFTGAGFRSTDDARLTGRSHSGRILVLTRPARAPVLHFVATIDAARLATDADVAVVLDPAFAAAGDRSVAARDLGAQVAAERDLFAETATLLDDWATRGRYGDRLVEDGVSFWFSVRLGMWWWLHERLIWIAIVDGLLLRHPEVVAIHLDDVENAALIDVASLSASSRKLRVAGLPTPPPARAARSPVRQMMTRLRRRLDRGRADTDADVRRLRERRVAERLALVGGRARRVLVLAETANRQPIDSRTGAGPVDPFLGPVLDALRGGPLDPITVEHDVRLGDDAAWTEFATAHDHSVLPMDAADALVEPDEADAAARRAAALAEEIRAQPTALVVDGVDLGPLASSALATRAWGLRVAFRERIAARRLMERLRPAALMLVNEYGRPGWIAAARDVGVPVVALQHGIIHRRHVGYVHRERPQSLALPDRTYVFGRWEQRLLVDGSVYRGDEVVVAGSPRLDISREGAPEERTAVRRELGVQDADRMLVVSTTLAPAARQFGIAPLVAAILDRPLPNVHLVFKLHPGEVEDDLYPRLVRALGEARGFEPPPVTVVKQIDLYRLLRAADGHLGLYSTVLTEAVVVGTRNFVGSISRSADLLGYVEAGVARPVRNGGDLLEGLDAPPPDPEARRRFIEDHFEPGSASQRIRDDLLAWLAPDARSS